MVYVRVKFIFVDEKKFDSCMYNCTCMLATSTTIDRCMKSED